MIYSAGAAVAEAREGFAAIGYRPSLIQRDYTFADWLGSSPTLRKVSLATFAQEPSSYRNACFGVVVAEEATPDTLNAYRSLGAPQLFVISESSGSGQRWRVPAEGKPQLIDTFASSDVRRYITDRGERWSPEAVLRAKTIGVQRGPSQLDFFDLGLLPAIEREVTRKLDGLFKEVLLVATNAFKRQHGRRMRREEQVGLFRLIFRLLAGKLLRDRGEPGEWKSDDASTVVAAVNAVYWRDALAVAPLADRDVQQAAWDYMREALHLQNLSVEALAYVYENTLVTKEARKQLGTHATPPAIAEFVVRHLPIDSLEVEERTVFEPFAGHAPFLIAALGRLKELRADLSAAERHQYFVRMLRGMEMDAFAVEVARYSLMLADYPNANGWNVVQGDVFESQALNALLRDSNIVLSNPPFGDFSQPLAGRHARKETEAVQRILAHPPRLLGLVLPRSVIDGVSFREIRKTINARYADVTITVLEHGQFSHADVEAAVVLASGLDPLEPRSRVSMYVANRDFEAFERSWQPTWVSRIREAPDTPVTDQLWHTQLEPIWRALRTRPVLRSALRESSRGVEYRESVRERKNHFVADRPRDGFVPGVFSAKGLKPYALSTTAFLRLDESAMRGYAHKKPWRDQKVLVPATRLSRGPWPLLGIVDRVGLMAYQSFHGLWPTSDWPVEVIAAILSGPVANAFAASQSATRRHNKGWILHSIPLPDLDESERNKIVSLVRQYERLVKRRDSFVGDLEANLRDLVVSIDAITLAGYRLTPRNERLLLDYFADCERPGVPGFRGYYPKDVRAAVPLRMLLSTSFGNSAAGRTLARVQPIHDPAAFDVLEHILDFGE